MISIHLQTGDKFLVSAPPSTLIARLLLGISRAFALALARALPCARQLPGLFFFSRRIIFSLTPARRRRDRKSFIGAPPFATRGAAQLKWFSRLTRCCCCIRDVTAWRFTRKITKRVDTGADLQQVSRQLLLKGLLRGVTAVNYTPLSTCVSPPSRLRARLLYGAILRTPPLPSEFRSNAASDNRDIMKSAEGREGGALYPHNLRYVYLIHAELVRFPANLRHLSV